MPNFEVIAPYQPAGDQAEAIAALAEGLENGLSEQVLLGVTGSGKTYTMAKVIEKVQRPALVLAHNKTLAAQLCAEFKEFFPNNAVEYFVSYYDYYQPEAYIPHTDTFIEKDASINAEIERLRHSATAALFERRDVIVVSSVSCIYGLGDPIDYANMIGLRGSPSFSGVKPVEESLDRADRGGTLNTRELLTIADLLTAARRTREYFNDEAAEKTAIDHLFLSLHGNRFLEEKIKSAILDEDTIADTASPDLQEIRRHMRAAVAKSRQILQRIISSPTYAKILQEAIITQRDGRFVVPVKAEHKGDLPGLVHDISSSGATLFVEPMGVVEANNELIELEAKEKKEIERILAEFSADAAAHREDISWDYDALVHLDLIFAKGQLSYKMDACRPEMTRE